jgi:hypothetical protein
MRLAQLARKVGKNQSEVIKFLADNGVLVEDHSNAKVEDIDVAQVMNYFAPALFEPAQRPEKETQTIVQAPETASSEGIDELVINQQVAKEVSLETVAIEKQIEVIKAPKIALQGLKVMGKIDLPEAKKKVIENENKPERPVRKESHNKKEVRTSSRQGQLKNPIAIQREKEEQEKQKKKLEKIAYLKELKTQRYLSKVRRPIDVYKEPKEKPLIQDLKPAVKQGVKSNFFITRLFKWLLKK